MLHMQRKTIVCLLLYLWVAANQIIILTALVSLTWIICPEPDWATEGILLPMKSTEALHVHLQAVFFSRIFHSANLAWVIHVISCINMYTIYLKYFVYWTEATYHQGINKYFIYIFGTIFYKLCWQWFHQLATMPKVPSKYLEGRIWPIKHCSTVGLFCKQAEQHLSLYTEQIFHSSF